jgi:hypothetical protein
VAFTLPASVNAWIDARLAAVTTTAINAANADITADLSAQLTALDSKLDALPDVIATGIESLMDDAKADILQGITAVPGAVNAVLSDGVLSVQTLTNLFTTAFNPNQMAQTVAQAIKNLTGGLLLDHHHGTHPQSDVTGPARSYPSDVEPWHGKAAREADR